MENITLLQIAGIVCGVLLAAAGFINQVGSAVERIMKAKKAVTAPTDELRKEIDDLKKWREDVDGKLGRDYAELRSIHEGNHAIYQALLALLDHGIDGNNIKQMEEAKSGLLSHLTTK